MMSKAMISSLIAIFMAITMVFVRLKAAKKPMTEKGIILPPIMMSSGFLMFLFPEFHLTFLQVIEALVVGVVFSSILIKTSKFKISGQHVYLIASKSFPFILIGLLAIRIILKLIVSQSIPLAETSGMFYILAFGMIVSWRIAMLIQYKKVKTKIRSD